MRNDRISPWLKPTSTGTAACRPASNAATICSGSSVPSTTPKGAKPSFGALSVSACASIARRAVTSGACRAVPSADPAASAAGMPNAAVFSAGMEIIQALSAIALLNTMVANGAFARISGREFDNPVMSIPLMPLLLLAFAASIVVTAFTVGDRMRRDTEGLV